MVKHICVLGGGSSGWISALALIRNTKNIQITLVESPDIKTVGVGEATIPYVTESFERLLGLKESDWMSECDAVYKTSIRFSDFYKKDTIVHHPFNDGFNSDAVFDWLVKNSVNKQNSDDFYESTHLSYHLSELGNFTKDTSYAHNLNADKFALVCKKKCIELGLNYVQDTVVSVEQNESGEISSLVCKDNKIRADFFIDASGFSALLIEKTLGDKFVSITDKLINDSAIVVQTPYSNKEKELTNYVNCTGMDFGWSWKIPLWNRLGNGYVYSSKFADRETVENEFRRFLGNDDLEFRLLKMRSGYQENPWTKNCLAVVLSAGFIEPLESTGLALTIYGIEQLIESLNNSGNNPSRFDAQQYNYNFKHSFNECLDFVQLHFLLTDREDTPYWKHLRQMEATDSLVETMHKFAITEIDEKRYFGTPGGFKFGLTSWYSMMVGFDRINGLPTVHGYTEEQIDFFNKRSDETRKKLRLKAESAESHYNFLKNEIHNET